MFTKIARFATLTLLGLSLTLATIAPVAAESKDGPKDGHQDTVKANHIDVYEITFYGDEDAMIGATGDGDIDIEIYDEDGDLVIKDVLDDDTPICIWMPETTHKYTIHVINNEDYAVDYTLLSN